MKSKDFQKLLADLGACSEAVTWAGTKSLAQVWSKCERADWMLWLVGKMVGKKGWPIREQLVLAACQCAELALPAFEKQYPDDKRPRVAVETAKAWAKGQATLDQVREAAAAAYAAYAAYAAAAAAAYAVAAYAAAAAAAAAYAVAAYAVAAYAAAAADAAYADAAYAVAAYAAAAAAADAAYHVAFKEEHLKMCKIIRKGLKIPK